MELYNSTWIFYFGFLIVFELAYFRMAAQFQIVDQPNERSSHSGRVIRGGGIIFPVAVCCWSALHGFRFPFFIAGLLVVSVVSFWDDIKNLKTVLRIFFQFMAVFILFYQAPVLYPLYSCLLLAILVVGFLNAYNFMDGINGMTGACSLVTIGSLYYVNHLLVSFTDDSLLLSIALSILVFSIFNFRTKARCFAGDVGSIGIAFILSFMLLLLTGKTGNFAYAGFFLVYGLDTGSTILFRIIRKENILAAHRSHFYQFLISEKKWPHLSAAMAYAGIQLLLNVIIIYRFNDPWTQSGFIFIALVMASALLFIGLRMAVEGKCRLIARK